MKKTSCLFLLFILQIHFVFAQETFCEPCSREAWLGDSAAINKFIASCGVIDTVSYDSLRNPVMDKAAYQTITMKLKSGKVLFADSVFFVAQQMPQFPGGETELFKYLSSSIHYPAEARKNEVSGTVYVRFIVERSGELSSLKILRGVGGGCDEEAIRVLKQSPKWSPGKYHGKPVRVQFNLPVKFALR